MWLVAGLGNPGAKYERNRHNMGFLACDALAEKYQASAWARKFSGEICEARGAGKVYFLKPQTFMNLSGESVAAAARFYKIPPEQVIVLYDELDLIPGKLRVRQGGGSGGHNGIKSIDSHLGNAYWRVRIGIGHPGHKDRVSGYVLSDFSKDDWDIQQAMLNAITQHFPLMLANDPAGFMNKVALTLQPPKAEIAKKQ
jgi:PTH1 family peptidyl-tRNA hydrolase